MTHYIRVLTPAPSIAKSTEVISDVHRDHFISLTLADGEISLEARGCADEGNGCKRMPVSNITRARGVGSLSLWQCLSGMVAYLVLYPLWHGPDLHPVSVRTCWVGWSGPRPLADPKMPEGMRPQNIATVTANVTAKLQPGMDCNNYYHTFCVFTLTI